MSVIDRWRTMFLFVLVATTLAACASYQGRGLQPGVATLPEVLAAMGEPAMRWQDTDGSLQLSYPRGPEGPYSFMVHLGADGRLKRIDNVLNDTYFARIVPGSDQAFVLRTLGPSTPQWAAYFKARDELVWEWLFCDGGGSLARFDVLFDGTTKQVRSTMARPDYRGQDGIVPPCGQLPPAN